MTNSTSTEVTFTFTSATTADEVTAAYQAADVSGKAALRAARTEAVTAAVLAADIELAQHLIGLESAMKSASKVTKVEVDYAQAIADRIATLEASLTYLREVEVNLPEGATTPTAEAVAAEVGIIDEKAVLAQRTFTGRKSKRGDVVAWIDSVLGDDPMTIAAMRRAWVATEDYPTAAPSAGAIGAALARVEDGAEASFEVVDIDGTKGAQRV